MANNKSYISYSFWMALMVIGVLLSATVIPRVEFGEYKTKKVNILSDIITFEDDTTGVEGAELLLDTTFMVNVPDTLDTTVVDTVEVVEHNWSVKTTKVEPLITRDISKVNIASIPIEEFDTIRSSSSVSEFYAKIPIQNY